MLPFSISYENQFAEVKPPLSLNHVLNILYTSCIPAPELNFKSFHLKVHSVGNDILPSGCGLALSQPKV